mgnify:FL=1
MQNEWTGLVIVRHPNSEKVYLYEAPAFTGLNKGDKVLCRVKKDRLAVGVVVHTDNVEKGSASVDMWADVTNATLPLERIEGIFEKCRYKDEEEAAATEEGGETVNGN